MSNTLFESLAIHAGQHEPGNATSTRTVPVHRTPSKLAKLSAAALLIGASAIQAEDIPVVNAGGAKISLYGFLQLNSVTEDGVSSAAAPNWSYFAPSDNKKGGTRTLLNVNHTRIGFNLSGPSKDGEPEVTGKFESDFNSSNARNNNGAGGFRIRQSFGQVKFKDLGLTLLLGQTKEVVSPLDPSVLSEGTVNYGGNLANRKPQIRLSQALGAIEIAIAAVNDLGANAPKAPALQGRVGAKVPAGWAGEKQNLELGVSGHFAKEKNTDTTDNQPYQKVPQSWSINADLSLPIISALGFSGEFFYGQDLQQLANGSLGLTPSSNKDPADGIKSLGGWAALGLKLPANLSFYGGFGAESISNDDDLKEGVRNSNLAIFTSLKYNFISNAFLGFEYFRIATDYTDKGDKKTPSGAINRYELAFNYAFK
jgi:hypothetical protein